MLLIIPGIYGIIPLESAGVNSLKNIFGVNSLSES